MKIFLSINFFLVLTFFLSGCGETYKQIGQERCVAKKGVVTEDTVIEEGGHVFSRIKTAARRGLQVVYKVPPEFQNKELWVVLEGRTRTNYAHSNATITLITTSEKGEMLCWKACFLRYHYKNVNEWCHYKDSIFLPSSFENKIYNSIQVFSFLGNSGSEVFDMDSLTVTVKQKVSAI